nr:zinc ribbon domain-containing protein [Chloroflexota bacterium]
MPLYEYICDRCQCKFELLRSFSKADEPAVCPNCESPGARRLLSIFAALSKGSDGTTTSVAGGGSCAACAATSCAGCKK